MTRTSLFSLVLLMVLGGNMVAEEPARLSITANLENCVVWLDGQSVGTTPIEDLLVAPGEHRLELLPPQSGAWDIQSKRYDLTLSAGQPRVIHALFSQPVFLNSNPFGARVYVDTAFIGTTPLHLSFEKYRGKEVELLKLGYKTHRFILNNPTPLDIDLEEDPASLSAGNLPSSGMLGGIATSHRKAKFGLLLLSVSTQWLGFYFQNEADRNFDLYQSAAEPAQAARYWDNTRKNDRFTTISLSVSYTALAGLIYYIIWK
ncbi:MAG: PEGA domain-containing protein [Calditrichaeota bacterium]|nr:PEGA domain-containing protein [Calditrichota bacterium]